MTTDSLETPAACASDTLNAVFLSSVKADGDMGRERAIRTSCVPAGTEAAVDSEMQSAFSALHLHAPMLVLEEGEVEPAPHFVQSEAPASANFPASQSEQVLADVAPKESEYLPDEQLEQVAEPTDALYLPAVQLVHEPPSGPLKPALHLHALMLVLEEGAVEPAPHFVQSEAPASANFPAGHWVQVLSDKAPVDAEDVPDWHLVHSAAPMLGENVPTGHACLSLANPGQ